MASHYGHLSGVLKYNKDAIRRQHFEDKEPIMPTTKKVEWALVDVRRYAMLSTFFMTPALASGLQVVALSAKREAATQRCWERMLTVRFKSCH